MIKLTVSKSKMFKGKPDKPGKPPVEPVEPPVEPEPPVGDNISGTFKGTVDIDDGEQGKAVEGTFEGTCDPATGEFDVMGVLIKAGAGGAVPVNTVAPTVSPTTASVGTVLSCSTGSWSNSPTSYEYQWMIGGADIGGATASTYATAAAGTLTCKVRASNASGPSLTYTTSSNSSAIAAGGGGTGVPLSSVSQFGFTLNFGQTLNCQQDVLGNWLVEMPVSNTLTPTSVSPAWDAGNQINGAMLDPPANPGPAAVQYQGYSNKDVGYTTFSDSVRFKTGTEAIATPTAPKSLVLTEGRLTQGTGGGAQILKKAIVVTFFPNGTLPLAGAIRPPFVAGPKHWWYFSELLTGNLPSRALPGSETSIPSQAHQWNSTAGNDSYPYDGVEIGQYMHIMHCHMAVGGNDLMPEQQAVPYGRDRCKDVGVLLLTCNIRAADNPNRNTHIARCFCMAMDYGAAGRANGLSYYAGAGTPGHYKALIMWGALVAPADARRTNIFSWSQTASDTLYGHVQTDVVNWDDHMCFTFANGNPGWGRDGEALNGVGNSNWNAYGANTDSRQVPLGNLFPDQYPSLHTPPGDANWGSQYRWTASNAANGYLMALADAGLRPAWNWEPTWDYFMHWYTENAVTGSGNPVVPADGAGWYSFHALGGRHLLYPFGVDESFNKSYFDAYVKVTGAGTPITSGTHGVAIANWTMTASGGTGPYTYSATGLPAGMTVNSSSGVVSGTPTTAGSYTVRIKATDTKWVWGYRSYTLVIA